MKIKLLSTIIICIFSLTVKAQSFDQAHNQNLDSKAFMLANVPITSEDIASLRGVHSLRNLSATPSKNKVIKNGDYDVSFDSQPPLVPHKSEYMRITLTDNRCLSCHSNANYKEEESAKMPSSHFKTRTGERLKKVSPRRYFCKQCHVSQVDAEPLIENTYENTDE
ncbi:nitrate reductase cytochrome c-type subunit [Candidatus Thioglobus sp.]|uniref:nitrate reductase cytochrome c-type subunit n=1 Tax=Candidatus Thioglobus sp. TaxID=2026721 RepID=UPI003D0A131F